MSEPYAYVLQQCTKRYGTRPVFKDISLSFYHGAKIGVLGASGSGKSTLLRVMAGIEQPSDGEAKSDASLKIGYLPQEPHLDDTLSVGENIRGNLETFALLDSFNRVSDELANDLDPDAMEELLEKQGNLQEAIENVSGWDMQRKMQMAMEALQCPPESARVSVLSGGERRRVAICKLLLSAPDLLLLDEPTNHLDAVSIAWLESWLARFTGTVVIVTHDRYFLDNVTNWILEIENGQGFPYKGNYAAWLEQKQQRLQHEAAHQKQLQKRLEREHSWLQQQQKASRAHNRGRTRAYHELRQQAQTDQKRDTALFIPAAQRLGTQVIEAKNLSFSVDDRVLCSNLSFTLPAGGIMGVIGANGVGKSQLLRIISAQRQTDQGELIIGDSVQLAYVDQSRDALNAQNSVWQEVSDGLDHIVVGHSTMPSRSYLAAFNFRGGDQQRLVSELSGGERNRLHLAKMLRKGGNVLLLDEPTNDLDIDTLRILEEALLAFAGSAIIVSHDRWFLDRVASSTLAHEGADQWFFFDGTYSDYADYRSLER